MQLLLCLCRTRSGAMQNALSLLLHAAVCRPRLPEPSQGRHTPLALGWQSPEHCNKVLNRSARSGQPFLSLHWLLTGRGEASWAAAAKFRVDPSYVHHQDAESDGLRLQHTQLSDTPACSRAVVRVQIKFALLSVRGFSDPRRQHRLFRIRARQRPSRTHSADRASLSPSCTASCRSG